MLLRQMLYRCEVRFLPIIAEHWFLLKTVPNYEELIRMLCDRMLDSVILHKFLETQDGPEFSAALKRLILNDGFEITENFEEASGPFRIAGMEKILRDKLWYSPISVTEKLWYRGLIYRENRNIEGELKACYILPDDLKNVLTKIIPEKQPIMSIQHDFMVRPAIPTETVSISPYKTDMTDFVCIGAALERDKRDLTFPGANLPESATRFIGMLIQQGSLLPDFEEKNTDSIRNFLIQNRTAANIQLIHHWRFSETYNELAESDELTVIESPKYDHRAPREAILKIISALQPTTWLSINGFISAIKKNFPQFLRGSFTESRGQMTDVDGNDLSGIGSWFQLEGAYLRFLLSGPLHWLGLVQIAFSDKDKKTPSAFRISQDALFYLQESKTEEVSSGILAKPNLEQSVPGISADGAIICGKNVSRYFRYMTTRYCEIENIKGDNTTFRITPASLTFAEENGLKRSSFLALLQRFSKNKVPPALEHMLSATELASLPATIYYATILTIPNENILEELLETPRLGKWIQQQINPTSILIDPKGISEIRRFLMEREVFVDIQV